MVKYSLNWMIKLAVEVLYLAMQLVFVKHMLCAYIKGPRTSLLKNFRWPVRLVKLVFHKLTSFIWDVLICNIHIWLPELVEYARLILSIQFIYYLFLQSKIHLTKKTNLAYYNSPHFPQGELNCSVFSFSFHWNRFHDQHFPEYVDVHKKCLNFPIPLPNSLPSFANISA